MENVTMNLRSLKKLLIAHYIGAYFFSDKLTINIADGCDCSTRRQLRFGAGLWRDGRVGRFLRLLLLLLLPFGVLVFRVEFGHPQRGGCRTLPRGRRRRLLLFLAFFRWQLQHDLPLLCELRCDCAFTSRLRNETSLIKPCAPFRSGGDRVDLQSSPSDTAALQPRLPSVDHGGESE